MAQSGLLVLPEHEPQTLIEIAQLAETLGFDNFWYADERFYREVYTGLTLVAHSTSRIGVGTAVTDPYTRHPALTAMAIGSLDELSGGRAILGYAAGIAGFRNLDLRPTRSNVALREGIHIIRELLQGKTVTHEGEMISLWETKLNFDTRPTIPIYLAASGPLNMRLAGEVADGVIIPHCASLKIFKPHLELVQEGSARAGRSDRPKIVARLDVSLSDDRKAALYEAKTRLVRILWRHYPDIEYLEAHGLELPAELEKRLREAGPFPGGHDLSLFRPFVDAIPDEFVYPINLVGTPSEVVGQAQTLIDAGADEIMAYLLVPPGETLNSVIQLYGNEVIPRLRSRTS